MKVTLKRDIEGVDWQAVSDVYAQTLGPDDPAQLARTWANSFATVLACVDGRIVGVAVLPEFQRQGIGTAMMRALIEDVKRTAILLTCLEDENVPFYENLGFRTHKRVMALGYRDESYV